MFFLPTPLSLKSLPREFSRAPAENPLKPQLYRHSTDCAATDCQSRSRISPSNTIRPSPRSDGNQESPSRLRVTVNGSDDRVQSTISLPDSPQSASMMAVATAPVPQATDSASTPRSNVR